MKDLNNKLTAMSHYLIRKPNFRLSLFLIVSALVAAQFLGSSSARYNEKGLLDAWSSGIAKSVSGNPVQAQTKPFDGLLNFNAGPTRWSAPLVPPVPQSSPETIDTFQADCTTSASSFNTGDTVCAHAGGTLFGDRRIYWVDPDNHVVQIDTVSSTSRDASRVVSQIGKWRVYLVDASDGSARAVTAFFVSDPQVPQVDLSIIKINKDGDPTNGNPITYEILATNNGPDTASSVQLTDSEPSGLSYTSSSQDSGPSFTRTQETPVTTWTIASLPAGASAAFSFTYQVNASAGTAVSNTVSITSTAAELHSDDNSSTATDVVASGGGGATCSLDCPNDIITTATTHGQGGGANVTFAAPDAFGSCGTVTSNPASGSFFPIGTTTVTTTSSTGDGFCSFTVTVVDTAAPTITCPANITVAANSGQSQAFVPDPNGSSSNVGTATATGDQPLVITGSRDDGEALISAYPVGITPITWTATDPSGRTATCTQLITVTSPDAPTIHCPSDKTFTAPTGSCQITVLSEDIGLPSTTGANVTVTNERSDGLNLTAPYPAGDTFITWTATNNLGSASCTQKIHVNAVDTEPPTLTVPPDVTATTSSCTATLDDELGVATATDNCTSSVNITRTGVPTFACPTPTDPNKQCESFVFPTGTTVITYTAKDAAGNTTVGTQLVTVLESPAIPPTITAPAAVTLYTGAGATSCSVTVSNLDATLGTATASDNCPGVTVARSNVPGGNVFPLGNTTITYTATDRSGNTASAQQVVTVVDNTPPVVTPPGAVTLYTGAGATSCSVTVSNLDTTLGTGSATDNCSGVGAVTRSGVPAGNVFPVGDTIVTYSATDAHNNTGTATQTVTVVDNTPPTITCPANITLEPTCPSGAIATYAAPVVGDNCGVQGTSATTSPTANLASGSVFPIGTTTVTNTVTDIHGNSSSCSFTVTVKTVFQTIEDLKTSVNSSSLNGTQKQGLLGKLNAAEDALNQGHTSTACQKLADFINSVQNYIDHGNISAAVGNAWISTAAHVRNTIGCTNNPCT